MKCQARDFMRGLMPCNQPREGYLALVGNTNRWYVCTIHGELFERPGYVLWVKE